MSIESWEYDESVKLDESSPPVSLPESASKESYQASLEDLGTLKEQRSKLEQSARSEQESGASQVKRSGRFGVKYDDIQNLQDWQGTSIGYEDIETLGKWPDTKENLFKEGKNTHEQDLRHSEEVDTTDEQPAEVDAALATLAEVESGVETLRTPKNHSPKTDIKNLQEGFMATLEEQDLEPQLEDKGGNRQAQDGNSLGMMMIDAGEDVVEQVGENEVVQMEVLEEDPGQLLFKDGPSTSGQVMEGGNLEELQPLDPVDLDPGPSQAQIPPPHLTPQSPNHPTQEGDFSPSSVHPLDNNGGPHLSSLAELQDGPPRPQPLQQGSLDDEDDDDDDDDDEDVQAPQVDGAYDPVDYEHLNVGPEIKELFSYITRYTPQAIELEHRLRPFIPDYIPAVGDIDAFIKIARPDGETSLAGLTVLDEPSARQSDSTVLDLQLRALAKQSTAKAVAVKTVENAEKNPKVIEKWVRDISDLHRAKPPPTVHYTKRMPDIDTLMQEWPGEVEELLKEVSLPTAALDLDLPSYVDIICSFLDIPVYKSRIQSLHVLFTLYSVFKNSAHFQQLGEDNFIDNEDMSKTDRLVLQ